jgi:hypothetical protein
MSWYTNSAFDRLLFPALRKRGWDANKLNRLALSILISGILVIVIGIIIVLSGIE